MPIYCPSCGRSIPSDSRVCAYCGKPIPAHGLQIAPEADKKDRNIALIIAVVLIIVVVVPIAIAATVYFSISSMVGNTHISTTDTPSITFFANDANKDITVVGVSSSAVLWSDIEISGLYNESNWNFGIVDPGDTITGCSGQIILTYEPTNVILFTHTFS
jgi:hypothetical protein